VRFVQQLGLGVGGGWVALFLLWFAGSVFVLRVIYQWTMSRFGSRLPTAVVFLAWTIAIVAIGGTAFGYGPPG